MKRIFYLITIFALVSCKKEEAVYADFPVTEECKDWSISKLKEITKNASEYTITYHPFDFHLDSHEEIKGYIRISNTYLKSKEELEGYFNAVLFGCHYTTQSVSDVVDLGEFIRISGMEDGYIKIKNGKATIWFEVENANTYMTEPVKEP